MSFTYDTTDFFSTETETDFETIIVTERYGTISYEELNPDSTFAREHWAISSDLQDK